MKNSTLRILPDMEAAQNTTETLTDEIRKLLDRSEEVLQAEGVKSRAVKLKIWLDTYRQGLSAAEKLSENSTGYLQEIEDRLKLALNEMQRLEDEGGQLPASENQKRKIDDLSQAIRRIDALIAYLGTVCLKPQENTP